MKAFQTLRQQLERLDGRGYPAYKSILGTYDAGPFLLHVDHVQGDPFADPSRVRAVIHADAAALPERATTMEAQRVAAADYLHRKLWQAFRARTDRTAGASGASGELRILQPGQEVLARTALAVTADGRIEARFRVGLPARGRTILGHAAVRLFDLALDALRWALLPDQRDARALEKHIRVVEDARALRAQLGPAGLVAFVANGAILPRRSGVDDRPLDPSRAKPFTAPPSLEVTLHAPHAGPISGLGVPAGVTLIVGGGFHGKSTLLRAIQRGVYDHVPGDGRERVVTVADAVKIRAEDGRAVAGTDISNFVDRLPGGVETRAFVTENASGSTSQAASLIEALESGATCLLLDEDTSATNLMIRDARMQSLVPAALEPITPFVDRVRQLATGSGVSTVMVVGGSGDYFDVADTVIAMHEYRAEDATAAARRIAAERPTGRLEEARPWVEPAERVPIPRSLDPRRGKRAVHVRAWSNDRVDFGGTEVDLRGVEQIVEPAQARAIALALAWAQDRVFDGRPLGEALAAIMEHVRENGLDGVQRERTGELAAFRVHELAAFLNRVRGFATAPRQHG